MTATAQQAERAALTAWRRRTDMTLRVVAAVPVGYAVGSLWGMALARIIPGDRAEAVVAATLVAFVICAVAAMWSFFARSGWHAVWTLAAIGGVAAAITWSSIALTGRL